MKIENVGKLIGSLQDKTEYVIHIRNLKEALNHELVLKKFIEWLNLIKKRKKWFWKTFFFLSWWIMQFLEKLCKIWEKIEILNLSQQKAEEII